MKVTCRRAIALATLTAMVWVNVAHAFQVLPKVSDVDRQLTGLGENRLWNLAGQWIVADGLKYKKAPVHEAITLAALGCDVADGKEMNCVTEKRVMEHRMMLYGVRWPDDPPFQLSSTSPPRVSDCDVRVTLRSTSQPKCWATLFFDAEKQAAAYRGAGTPFGVGSMILYRSHFGDLQFMHSMAAGNGETAGTTRQRMLSWSHYLWEMAGGRLASDVYLRDLPGQDMAQWFPGDMTTQNLLSSGLKAPRKHMEEVALGVLLHMVQDSFSVAHAQRAEATGARCSNYSGALAPGKVLSFRSYVHQKSTLHDAQDTASSMGLHTTQSVPSAVDASRVLVKAWKAQASWDEVMPYMDCLLTLDNSDTQAGPGPYL